MIGSNTKLSSRTVFRIQDWPPVRTIPQSPRYQGPEGLQGCLSPRHGGGQVLEAVLGQGAHRPVEAEALCLHSRPLPESIQRQLQAPCHGQDGQSGPRDDGRCFLRDLLIWKDHLRPCCCSFPDRLVSC